MVVLANFDELCKNTPMGRLLTIGRTEYARGVFCHTVSRISVCLPGPGKALTAVVGVDSNPQTKPGRGSIVFSVVVKGQEAFRSKIMKEGTVPEHVKVDLDGATDFLLEVGDAGDGITCG
ncbi:MAG TPA: NPCBM/NEW2 domain-containing protein [Phycisphaerae bacterium]|nr:NPCBM/NEW2 domain-containing protein [Phycisphaerae bacterium]HRY69787.1 NPCBM/NEW2 domain-containing protein [Phycisphaerae bacterium]HSA25380.1 NPCBM/NEW2 domain-containing protein [Phycisphaerae bacterium]